MVAPLVAAGIGAALNIAGGILGNNAAKKTSRRQTEILTNLVNGVQRPQFDYRMANTRAGDATQRDLSQQALDAELDTRSRGLGDVLAQAGAGFDKSLSLRDTNSAEQTGISLADIAKNRDIRLSQKSTSDAELARQQAFQAQADALAAGYKTTMGAPQEAVDRAGAVAGRDAAVDATVTGPSADPSSATAVNPILKAIFAAELAKGMNDAKNRAKAGNQVRGYGDALVTAGRRNVNFNDALNIVDAKAGISASALPAELGVGAIERENANAASAARSQILEAFFGGSIDANNTRTSQGVENTGDYYDEVGAAQRGNFTRLAGAEADRTGALNNASSEYEDGRGRTANYQASQINYTSPLGSLLTQAGSAMIQSGGSRLLSGLGKIPTPNTSPVPYIPSRVAVAPNTSLVNLNSVPRLR